MRRIFNGLDLRNRSDCVLIPVLTAGGGPINIEGKSPIFAIRVRVLLESAQNAVVMDDLALKGYPMRVGDYLGKNAANAEYKLGEISCDGGLKLRIVLANVHRGAALNSIQIKEHLLESYLS